MTWVIRLVGFVLCWVAFSLLLHPVCIFLKIIPALYHLCGMCAHSQPFTTLIFPNPLPLSSSPTLYHSYLLQPFTTLISFSFSPPPPGSQASPPSSLASPSSSSPWPQRGPSPAPSSSCRSSAQVLRCGLRSEHLKCTNCGCCTLGSASWCLCTAALQVGIFTSRMTQSALRCWPEGFRFMPSRCLYSRASAAF
jgi:hypothetical protein